MTLKCCVFIAFSPLRTLHNSSLMNYTVQCRHQSNINNLFIYSRNIRNSLECLFGPKTINGTCSHWRRLWSMCFRGNINNSFMYLLAIEVVECRRHWQRFEVLCFHSNISNKDILEIYVITNAHFMADNFLRMQDNMLGHPRQTVWESIWMPLTYERGNDQRRVGLI